MAYWAAGATLGSAALGYLGSRNSGSPTQATPTSSQSINGFVPNAAAMPLYGWMAGNAQNLMQTPRGYYPGQGYVSPSQMTQQGVDWGGMGAMSQANQLQGMNRNYNFLSNAADVANNPYVQNMLQTNQQQVNQNLNRNLLPGISNQAQSVNALGSGRQGLAQGQALGDTSTGLANANNNMMLGAYQQGLGAQQSAMNYGAQHLQNQGAPGQSMLNMGNIVEGYQNSALQDQMARYNYMYDQPWDQMGKVGGVLEYLQPLGRTYGSGAGTSQQPNPGYMNPLSAAIGAGNLGYGVYDWWSKQKAATPMTPPTK